ncbi:MAG: CoA transferase [Pseudomonadota bacterium]
MADISSCSGNVVPHIGQQMSNAVHPSPAPRPPPPLAGLRVLDMTHVLAGPFAAWCLARMGADVVKIEDPRAPDCTRGRGPEGAEGLTYRVQGTMKRAVALDLWVAAGRDALRALASGADLLIENRRAGWLDRRGVGLDELREGNARLVTCSITGYGAGPWGAVGAYDNTVQAASGAVAQSGGVKPGLSFVDYAAGHAAAFACLAALMGRPHAARHVDVSMQEVALGLMAPEAAAARAGLAAPPKEAGIRAYICAEGVLMAGAFTPAQHRRLGAWLVAEGHAVSALDGCVDWPATWAAAEDAARALGAVFAARPARAWAEGMRGAGLPAEAVATLAEAVRHPAAEMRGAFAPDPDGGPDLPVGPWRVDGMPPLTPAPAPGADADAVLRAAGCDPDALRAAGALG